MAELLPRLIMTTGDPAGIGPDVVLKVAMSALPARVVVIGDRDVLTARAKLIGVDVEVVDADVVASDERRAHRAGVLPLIHRRCDANVVPGELNPDNGQYVIGCIDAAVDGCLAGEFDAIVTAPVNKTMINQSGIVFSGHTEWIAARCSAPSPVMMLANGAMRVCLLTNHIPLAQVARHVSASRLREVIEVIRNDLRDRFNIAQPTIGVCGLNPHAGEGGYLGNEEIEIITPTLEALRADGANLIGPIPADTAFTRARLKSLDAVLAMYHDQGLAPIKHAGFGDTVNITLGLPIIRTSVDHGSAYELAGTSNADESSLRSAVTMAVELSANVNR